MEDRKDVTVPMPSAMVDEVEDNLGYGDSRAEWIREAVRQRLERERNNDEGNQTRATAD